MPAFSPGPQMTCGPSVGRVRNHFFEDLYEQCSFHMAEKMPSSVKFGMRPIISRMRSYSSGLRPCAAINSGVISGSFMGYSSCGEAQWRADSWSLRHRRARGKGAGPRFWKNHFLHFGQKKGRDKSRPKSNREVVMTLCSNVITTAQVMITLRSIKKNPATRMQTRYACGAYHTGSWRKCHAGVRAV